MSTIIQPGERRELRAIVRQQFKVLRTEVKQRERELVSEAEMRLVERYRDQDKRVDDLNWRIHEATNKANREIADLLKEFGEEAEGGRFGRMGGGLFAPTVNRRDEDRSQLHRALVSGIKAQVDQANLTLDRQEADLLRSLAMEVLESDAARAFLARIPTVSELVPAARLREIERQFDGQATP